jgi:hypothetical protein
MKFSLVFVDILFVKVLNVKIPMQCKCITLHLTVGASPTDCIGQNTQ